MAEFTAHYERKYSDGAYGSEGLSLSMTWDMSEGELPSESVEVTFHRLRALVLTELSKSQARQVAYAAKHELELHDGVPAAEPDSLEDLPF